MLLSEFICDRCGYRSEHLLVTCPNCAGFGANKKPNAKLAAEISGPYSAAQMEKWTGVSQDPVKQAEAQFGLLKGLRAACLAGVFICAFMYVPCFIIPTAVGVDRYGFYTFPSKKTNAPMKMSYGGMMALNLANTIALIACFGGFLYFKRRTEDGDIISDNDDLKIF